MQSGDATEPSQRFVAVVVAGDAEPLDRRLVALQHPDQLGHGELRHDQRGPLLGGQRGVAEGVLVVRRQAAVQGSRRRRGL